MEREETTTERRRRELEAVANRFVAVWERWLGWCRAEGIDPREARKLDLFRYQDAMVAELGDSREQLVIITALYETAGAFNAAAAGRDSGRV